MHNKFDKTSEILFDLKVSDAMKKDVITISPKDEMIILKNILRKHRISGVPVADDKGILVGIISLEDLIRWMDDGCNENTVEEVMTKNPQTLYADQPLIHAVKKFEKYGFGRCPVVDKETNKVIGIVTKGNIIEGTLEELEKEYKEEEIRQYRVSHFFKDVIADDKEIILKYNITARDFDNAGKASVTMKKNLKRLGIDPKIVQRVAIASYEAEMNLVIYSEGGTIKYIIAEDEIKIFIEDIGPGIADVEKAMQPGYTTAEPWVKDLGFGAGMGLPNIKKCVDEMKLESELGKGTSIILKVKV